MVYAFDCLVCGVACVKKGDPRKAPKFCSRACSNKAPGRMTPEIRARIGRRGPRAANFKTGEWVTNFGRVRKWVPHEERHLHPTCDRKGYMFRYHLVWNRAHPDDPVQRGEVIHHLDGNSMNDALSNLVKLSSQSEHWREHASEIAARRTRDALGRFV